MRTPGSTIACARCSGLLLLFALVGPILPAADNPPPAEPAVALPPFIVEELAKGPPWRYAESPGYEILSRCNDATTRRVVDVHFQLHVLLAEILPPALRLKLSVPHALIIYDEELQPAASQEVIRRLLRPSPGVAEEERSAGGGGRGFRMPSTTLRYSFLPNLRLWDRDSMAVFMIVRSGDFDTDRLALTHDYISFLVKRRLPALPPWFVTGFLAMYRQTTYNRGELAVEPLEWISEFHTDALKKDPTTAPPVLPLGPFFAAQLAAREPTHTYEPIKAWHAQASLFVRWGLEADRSAHRAAFWKFVERSASEGASEALFADCFGFDCAMGQERLTAYLPGAVRRTLRFRPARPTKLPPLVLHNATDGQISRLKGDWERLEVPYVKAISAELAPKYLEQARRTLRRAYDRDERDPRLLAAMGLCEVDAGNDTGAREYLEAAQNIGPLRPRASYELARLRFAEFSARPAAAEARLDVVQTADVLRPLFVARSQEPPLPEVYELIAEAWGRCEAVPTRRHLAVLDEGVRYFPRQAGLIWRAAELYLRHGYTAEADVLVELGAKVAEDDATRAKFDRLREQVAAQPGESPK